MGYKMCENIRIGSETVLANCLEFRIAIIFGVISLSNKIVSVITTVSKPIRSATFTLSFTAMSAVMSAARIAIDVLTIVQPVRSVISKRLGFFRSLSVF